MKKLIRTTSSSLPDPLRQVRCLDICVSTSETSARRSPTSTEPPPVRVRHRPGCRRSRRAKSLRLSGVEWPWFIVYSSFYHLKINLAALCCYFIQKGKKYIRLKSVKLNKHSFNILLWNPLPIKYIFWDWSKQVNKAEQNKMSIEFEKKLFEILILSARFCVFILFSVYFEYF